MREKGWRVKDGPEEDFDELSTNPPLGLFTNVPSRETLYLDSSSPVLHIDPCLSTDRVCAYTNKGNPFNYVTNVFFLS